MKTYQLRRWNGWRLPILSLHTEKHAAGEWSCSPMVGRSSGMLPNRVQILMLAPFLGIFCRIYRRYALIGKWRSRQQQGANGDFGNLQICQVLSSSEVITGVGFVYVCSWGWVCVHVVRACIFLRTRNARIALREGEYDQNTWVTEVRYRCLQTCYPT
jgi:hypothetical protein